MNSVGVMPSSKSSRRACCQRSHCVPACPPPDGAPLAAPPLITIPAPESAAAVLVALTAPSPPRRGVFLPFRTPHPTGTPPVAHSGDKPPAPPRPPPRDVHTT